VSRVGLDAIEATAKAAEEREWELEEHPGNPPFTVLRRGHRRLATANLFGPGEIEHIASMDPQTTLSLVAELRVAREVVKQARPYEDYIPPQDVPPGKHPLADALAAYDKAVMPS
jgi:hypothetical protein